MIAIDLLKNHPEHISQLAAIWHEVLGKIWMPDVPLERIIARFSNHLNAEKLPLTFFALDSNIPVGMCSLRKNDGVKQDLLPWLGSLVVEPKYQKQGIGRRLINTTMNKAKQLGFNKLYLFTFDLTLPKYYAQLGWVKIGMNEFEGRQVTVMEAII